MIIRKFSTKVGLSLILVLLLTVFAGAAAAAVNDLDNHWAKDEIGILLSKGVLSGYPDQTFRPDQPMSRAEYITLLNKAFEYKDIKTISYPDVSPQDWFSTQVQIAANQGYIQGYEDGYFRPNVQISRQEAVVILYRILNLKTENLDNIKTLADIDQIPEWSQNAISALIRDGYIKGYPDNTFRPTSPISRAEAAVVLNKVLSKIVPPDEPQQPEPPKPDQGIVFSQLGTRPLLIPIGNVNSITMQIEDISSTAQRFGLQTEDLISGQKKLAINVDNQVIEFEVIEIPEIEVTVLQASWISNEITSEQEAKDLTVVKK